MAADQKVSYDVVAEAAARISRAGEDLRHTATGFACRLTPQQVGSPGVATAIADFFDVGGQVRDGSGGRVEDTGADLDTGLRIVAAADDDGAYATTATGQELAGSWFLR